MVHVCPYSRKGSEKDKMMTLNDYQRDSYIAIQQHESNKEEVMHWAIGLGEEAGEALSVIKHKYYGGHYSVEDLVGELGDTLWHVAALCTALGIDLNDVAEYNIAKLRYRYPTLQFDEQRSKDRHMHEGGFKSSVMHNHIMSKVINKMSIQKPRRVENADEGF